MIQSGIHASAEPLLESTDFDRNHRYVKRLMQGLKEEDQVSLRKELFGEHEVNRTLDKKQIAELFRVLRKVDREYRECSADAPIPQELENSIRGRHNSEWLPWEMEAIEKVEVWREEMRERKTKARLTLERTLEKFRK